MIPNPYSQKARIKICISLESRYSENPDMIGPDEAEVEADVTLENAQFFVDNLYSETLLSSEEWDRASDALIEKARDDFKLFQF